MLVITRKPGETFSLYLNGKRVAQIVALDRNAKIGIIADPNIKVLRDELTLSEESH